MTIRASMSVIPRRDRVTEVVRGRMSIVGSLDSIPGIARGRFDASPRCKTRSTDFAYHNPLVYNDLMPIDAGLAIAER
jgi:hypothetical protein